MKTIKLSPKALGSKLVVGLHLPYHSDLASELKSIDCKWDHSLQVWVHAYTAESIKKITNHFKGRYFVDYRSFKGYRPGMKVEFGSRLHSVVPASHGTVYAEYCEHLIANAYAPSTKETYQSMVKLFLAFFKEKELSKITNTDINTFFADTVQERNYSVSTQRQLISALKILFSSQLNFRINIGQLPNPRKDQKLPKVLSQVEIKLLMAQIRNLKHRCLVSVQYGCGLRVAELLDLKVGDVDLDAGLLFVSLGKGRKDRRIKFPGSCVPLTKAYLEAYAPTNYFFEGQGNDRYSATSVNAIIKRAAGMAGIKKQVTSHMLRHSYATHLMERGVDLRIIQELLGHKSSRTTEIYTHVSQRHLNDINSPLDDIQF